MTSLMTTYINSIKKGNSVSYISQNKSQDAYRTHIKPYAPKGRLIEESCLNPVNALKNDVTNFKNMVNGLQGKGTDYTVGTINDIALKLGGLGIASVIFANRNSVTQKAMEFAGLGCWLSSMSLWPKLGVYLPLKIFKGPDLSLKYENAGNNVESVVEKKNFYMDPQYLCWDLVPRKRMNRLANQLGIKKSEKNRIKKTEEWAKKVAIQGNTIAMLSAGIATPVVASLAGDFVEKKAVLPTLTKVQEYLAKSQLEKLNANISSVLPNEKAENAIVDILKSDLTIAERKEALQKIMYKATGYDSELKETFQNAVDNIYSPTWKIVLSDKLNSQLKNIITPHPDIPKEKISAVINELVKKYGKDGITQDNILKFKNDLSDLLSQNRITHNASALALKAADFLKNKAKDTSDTINETVATNLKELSKIAQDYGVKVNKGFIDKFVKYIWDNDVAINADIWRRMDNEILPMMGFSNEDIKILASKPTQDAFFNTVNSRLKTIASDNVQYKDAIEKLSKFALKQSERNEKYLKSTLDYIDNMEKILTNYSKTGKFSSISQAMANKMTNMRRMILGKYLSANLNLFMPIRLLDLYKNGLNSNDIDTNVLKEMFLSHQQVDSFINKLDNFSQNVIKNEPDIYKKYISNIFAGLSENTKKLIISSQDDSIKNLQRQFCDKLDDTTQLFKYLMIHLCDGTNTKFLPGDGASKNAIRYLEKLKLSKYLDSLFSYEITQAGKEDIITFINLVLDNNPEKSNAIATFLNVSAEKLKSDRTELAKEIPDFLNATTTDKLKKVMMFLDVDNIFEFFRKNCRKFDKNIKILKTFPLNASKDQGKTAEMFIAQSAENIFKHRTWFNRVAITFGVVAAVTGAAIALIGSEPKRITEEVEVKHEN